MLPATLVFVVFVLASGVSARSVLRVSKNRNGRSSVRAESYPMSESGNATTLFVLTAIQRQIESLADGGAAFCEEPAQFQRRVGVFYGVPPTRVHIMEPNASAPAPPSCVIQFWFQNNTGGNDYYTNAQLTALILSLNTSYLFEYLNVQHLSVNATEDPHMDPTPRTPPLVQAMEKPKKHFVAVFTSVDACLSFQESLPLYLNVGADRVQWATSSCSPSMVSNAGYSESVPSAGFAISDVQEEQMTAPPYRVVAADSGDGSLPTEYPLPPMQPIRSDIENAILTSGLPRYVFTSLISLQYTVEGSNESFSVVANDLAAQSVLVVSFSGDSLFWGEPFGLSSALNNAFQSNQNGSLWPLLRGASTFNGLETVALTGEGLLWSSVVECLSMNRSVATPSELSDEGHTAMIVGILFGVVAVGAAGLALHRRKMSVVRGLDGEYVNQQEDGRVLVAAPSSQQCPARPYSSSGEEEMNSPLRTGQSKTVPSNDKTTLLSSAM